MPKCDFNKVALQFFGNHTSTWVFSCKLVHIFRTPLFQNTYGGLLSCWESRGVAWTLVNIKGGELCKALHLRCMQGSSLRLWKSYTHEDLKLPLN